MYKRFFFILLIGLSCTANLLAQEKFEKESRIKQRDVPLKAFSFMDSLNFNTKIKWYKEEGLTRNSIEAKFKHNKTNYSIEFDTLGNIEDIETEVNWADVELMISKSIARQFMTDCSKHKIVKVQKQYSRSENDLFSLLKTGIESEQLTVGYEIIVKCIEQGKANLFEYLFNENGLFLSKSKIIFKNSSHLEY